VAPLQQLRYFVSGRRQAIRENGPMNDQRKRTGPTIDLTATELPSSVPKHAAATTAEPPSSQPERATAQSETSPRSHKEGPARESSIPPRRSGGRTLAALSGGLVGAMVACGVLVALWYAEVLPTRTVASRDQSQQIASLQSQIRDLQTPPVAAADSQAIDVLRQRLSKLENDIAQLPPGDKTVAERLAAADNAMKSLGIALAALNKRSDDVAAKASQAQVSAASNEKTLSELRDRVQGLRQAASAADSDALEALRTRMTALEQSLTAARDQTTETAAAEKAMRLALSAVALRETVERGAPYQAELDQAKMLSAGDTALAALDQFAGDGLPTSAALARQLADLVPVMMKAVGDDSRLGGFFERLQANAGKLVRIRPVNPPEGDSPSEVLARIEVDIAHADIDAALSDVDQLPQTARQKAANWVNTAAARQKALAAARQFAANAARGVGKPAGANVFVRP
jgi:hypothetical protein